ncbi:MAG: class I SAM-dependent methyltransferase [Nitrospinota bacterium]|nr:MAG: class I SAM-dependent methyltransferase [Nitrospinota bacterium]
MAYQPSGFWEKRLQDHFSLVGTGRVSFSPWYNRWLYRAKRRGLQKVWDTLGISPAGKRVLDIGCGTGFFVAYYQEQGATVTGIDITQISVETLRQRFPQFTFYQRDIGSAWEEMLPPFDLVHVFDVLYHLTGAAQFAQALHNIGRLTRPGGYVLLTDAAGQATYTPAPHVTFRSLATYQERLAENGLSLLLVVPLYHFLNRRLFSRSSSQSTTRWARLARWLDDAGAPLWYGLDGLFLSANRANMRLLVAQKQENT